MEQLLNLLQSNNIDTNDYDATTFFLFKFLNQEKKQLFKSGTSEYNALYYQYKKKTDPTFIEKQRMFSKKRLKLY